MFTQLSFYHIHTVEMFHIHRIEKVVGPVFGPMFDQNRIFLGGPGSVPRTFFINRKVLPRGSGGVLVEFVRLFWKVFRKVPRSFSSTPGWPLNIFGKIGFGALWAPRAPSPIGPQGPKFCGTLWVLEGPMGPAVRLMPDGCWCSWRQGINARINAGHSVRLAAASRAVDRHYRAQRGPTGPHSGP